VLRIIPKPEKLEKLIDEILEMLKPMEAHIVRARYPLKDENGRFIIPSEYYKKTTAEKLLENAKKVLEKTRKAINSMSSSINQRNSIWAI